MSLFYRLDGAFSRVDDGLYVNGMTDFDALGPVRAAYGPEKYARLVDIKTTHNLFRRNANIAPAG